MVAIPLLLAVVSQPLLAETYVYNPPGTIDKNKERIRYEYAYQLVSRLYLDGKPLAYFRHSESTGNPYVYWITDSTITFLGCGERNDCDDTWRTADTDNREITKLQLPGFSSRTSWPIFFKSYMGYRAMLPNGNLGCIVYDWSSKQELIRWDSGNNLVKKISVEFSDDGSSVTCRSIVNWKPNPNYAGGDDPSRFPVYGKSHKQYLLNTKNKVRRPIG